MPDLKFYYSHPAQRRIASSKSSCQFAFSWRRKCRHSSQIFDARGLLHPAELKASTKKNFLSGRPGEENPQRIFTGRMDAKSPFSHRQNQTNFRSALATPSLHEDSLSQTASSIRPDFQKHIRFDRDFATERPVVRGN